MKISSIPIIRDNEINITEEEWRILNSKLQAFEIAQLISDAIEKVPLPYTPITLEEAVKDFEALQDLDSATLIKNGGVFTKYPYKYEMTGQYIDVSRVGNKASNYFHQESRYRCDSLNSPSPHRVWTTEKFRLNMLKNLWTMPTTKVDTNRLRSALNLRCYVASQFRPSAAKAVYDLFNSKNVLDFSAGWGDRLTGFSACSDTNSYTGNDPNVSLLQGYTDQIGLYGSDKSYRILSQPAEELNFTEQFDTVFSSPPYFCIERYSQDNTQSWKRYKKLDDWLEKFLFVAVEKAWRALKPNGIMAINIADVYGHHRINNICDPLNDFISTLPNAEFQGGLGYRMAKRPNSAADKEGIYVEPIWCWRRLSFLEKTS
jgi:hypothetical protein